MAYATSADVVARAGALSAAWTDTSIPSLDDLDTFCSDVAAEIDGYLGGRGLTTPAEGAAAAALKSVNADGALVLGLTASYPEGAGPASASKVIDDAQARYEAAKEAIADGTHPAVTLLEAGNVGNRASSFWENEPLYGIYPSDPDIIDINSPDANRSTRPTIERGRPL